MVCGSGPHGRKDDESMAGEGKINATVMVTREERKMLKRMALDRDTTVSDMVRGLMYEHMSEGEAALLSGKKADA